MSQEIRTKGSNIVAMIAALETVRDAAFRETVVKNVPGAGGEEMRAKSVLAAGWYPIGWYRDLLGTIVKHADANIVRELGRASTRANVSTIHRIFMRMISPHTLIKQGGRLFSSYFETRRSRSKTWKGKPNGSRGKIASDSIATAGAIKSDPPRSSS